MSSLNFDGNQPATPVGYFDYLVADDAWNWSAGVFELHGYAPDSVRPSTELVLRHKHPDDMARSFEVLENAIANGGTFSCYHRVIDVHERVRSVLSVGRGVPGTDGEVERVTGYFVDLTEVRRTETQAEVDSALAAIARTRSVIDQAKGMLMLATGCDDEGAFAVLRTYSSHKNIKLHLLAQQLVEAGSRPQPEVQPGQTTVMSFLDSLDPFSVPAS